MTKTTLYPIGLVVTMAAVVLTGCGVAMTDETTATPPAVTGTPPPATATAIPTIEATPEEVDSLILWLPDAFVAASSEDTSEMLNAQIAEFAATDEIGIEIRRKRLREAGGIMPTLRTARNVAPGVLPDLTLIQREDLVAAVNEGLIQPMESIVPSVIVGDLYPSALDLGQVNGTLYALPYMLDVQHMVYHPDVTPLSNSRFATVASAELPLLFPAQRSSGLNTFFLMQYVAAGGRLDGSGDVVMDEAILTDLLQAYEAGVDDGWIQPSLLNYTRPQEYLGLLSAGDYQAALVTTPMYLDLLVTDTGAQFGAVPTLNGQPVTALNGWMWVMTTTNPNRQKHVSSFLSWMMDTERQGDYAQTLRLVPSQRTATRRSYDEAYTLFLAEMLNNAVIAPGDVASGVNARAIQTAFSAVINDEQTTTQAVRDALSQLNN
jgi:maltose-binding protein MalE